MGEAWRNLDLEGGGLQAANLKLARLLKRRARAYALLAAFPLGLHRSYLDEPRGAWAFRALTLVAAAGFVAGWAWLGWGAAAALVGWTLYDLRWIDDRVAAVNKRLRMQVYLRPGGGAPAGFRGRYTDDAPAGEQPTTSGRAPSFAEQERLLRELARRKAEKPQKN